MNKLNIGGKEYPCRVTMGAMVRFKREAGKDISELSKTDIGELILFIWCCVKSACNADKVDFDLDVDTFADLLEPDSVNDFYAGMASEGQKKTKTKAASGRA